MQCNVKEFRMNINNIKTMRELNIILDDGYESYSYLDDEFLPVYELRYRQKLVNSFSSFESLVFHVRKKGLYKF